MSFFAMKKSVLMVLCSIALMMSVCTWNLPSATYGQTTDTNPSSTEKTVGTGNSVVSVSSKVTVQVANETLPVKEKMLRSAVFSFLNSGPTILKTSDNDQLVTKTKVTNKINNVTQSVEGIEASNAIIGVEISKALKTLVSSPNPAGRADTITLDTSSTCKLASAVMTSCDNTITINQ